MPRNPNPLLADLRTHCAKLLPECTRVYTTQYQGNNRHRAKFFQSTKLNVPTAIAIRQKLKQHGWKEVIIKEMKNPFCSYRQTQSLQIFATKE
jgi:hypothetical protein